MEAQPLRTEIQQGIIHHKGRPAHQGEAENFRQSIVLHSITKRMYYVLLYHIYNEKRHYVSKCWYCYLSKPFIHDIITYRF